MQQLAFAYKMLTNYDIEDPPKIQTIYDVSEMIQCFSYFNFAVPEMNQDFVFKLK
jgi:hypothetical protein